MTRRTTHDPSARGTSWDELVQSGTTQDRYQRSSPLRRTTTNTAQTPFRSSDPTATSSVRCRNVKHQWARNVKHQLDFHTRSRPSCDNPSLLNQAAQASGGGFAAASAGRSTRPSTALNEKGIEFFPKIHLHKKVNACHRLNGRAVIQSSSAVRSSFRTRSQTDKGWLPKTKEYPVTPDPRSSTVPIGEGMDAYPLTVSPCRTFQGRRFSMRGNSYVDPQRNPFLKLRQSRL